MRTDFSSSSSRSSTPPGSTPHSRKSSYSPVPSPPRCEFSLTFMEENIENAEETIRKWDLQLAASTSNHDRSNIPLLFSENNSREAQLFIRAVTDLRSATHYFLKVGSCPEKLVRAQNLIRIAMRILEREFYTLLEANRRFLDPEVVSALFKTVAEVSPTKGETSTNVIESLKTITGCMISCGYGKECAHIYKIIRKSIVDERLYYLGVEKVSSSQIRKMDWDQLEITAKNWLEAVKTAVRRIFHGERILNDVVFSSSESFRKSCFTDIAKDSALMLFCFPKKLVRCKKFLSPERIFRFLDLYETFSDLWTEIEVIFSSDSLSAIRSQAATSLLKLGEAVGNMLSQFEAAIQKDSSKTAVPGGGVHPLTRYVMNYLIFLADYSDSVEDIIADWPVTNKPPLPESFSPSSVPSIYDESPRSAISVWLVWVLLLLLCKLDSKAVLYKEHVALSYLFLANNLNYVVSKVRASKLNLLIGPAWISQQESTVKQFISSYKKMGWIKVMMALPHDPTAEISLPEIKGCFKRFNTGFEEAYRVQSSWVIPDLKLRDEVKISLPKAIVLAYRVFCEKYRGILTRDIEAESIVRYTPNDLENYLGDLFYGNIGAAGDARTVSSKAASPFIEAGR